MRTLIQTLFFFLLVTQICFAQFTWNKEPGNPMLTAPNSWYSGIMLPFVLYNSDSSRYEMWFTGSTITPIARPFQIGFAVSIDGISWTIHSTPVLSPRSGNWDNYSLEGPCVIREGGLYKMWYTAGGPNAYQYKIGYATSTDGINWSRLDNPVFESAPNTWEIDGVAWCSVIPFGLSYKMWYVGYNISFIPGIENIGFATSVDGISWQRDTLNNPVLVNGDPGQWDDTWVSTPRVLFELNHYYLIYCGTGAYMGNHELGLATSSDGIYWQKFNNEPILRTSPGQWDMYNLVPGNLVMVGDSLLKMWYEGSTNTVAQIGLATSPFEPVSVDNEITQPTEFSLEQNYPNPFNPSTIIIYQLPIGGNVTLKVFDILGNELATLVDEFKPAGKYETEFNAASLPSGVYFYQLKAVDPESSSGQAFISAKKMILLK